MSDIMRPIAIADMFDWINKEHAQTGRIFGVRRFYADQKKATLPIFDEKIEMPLGPAAGPATQLAQNIIASYLGGARFFELKTCQILDGEDLPVAKPCITAADECYNCEWSTELRVEQAYEEYVKAWFVLKILSKELKLGDPDAFAFNMSVGYDLEGIKSKKMDDYINGMKDASKQNIWQECKNAALERLSSFNNITKEYIDAISPVISRSITLSTLHGCPPEEIERISSYLISEKKVHTFVKCNPTMLGYEFARNTLDSLGYDYITFDDHHFNADLQYEDAVPMFGRLQKLADDNGLEFGVKLSNTFPVQVAAGELPSEEMYMSGRALFPLTMEMCKRLCKAFDGKLRISYSGGADIFSVIKLFECNIWPITVATTILKPGGYQRFLQMAVELSTCDFVPFETLNKQKIDELVLESTANAHYHKPIKPLPNRKIQEQVPLSDCFVAPCRNGCPIEQDIPAYLKLVDEGRTLDALNVIVDKNPLPFITGTICNHKCMDKCTRAFYEESVHIRAVKLEAAMSSYDEYLANLEKVPLMPDAKKVAVVGGGPGGISLAHFLAREGTPVTVYEKRDMLGGVPRHVVPEFRLSINSIEKDVDLARKLGAKFIVGQEAPSLEELRKQGFDCVVYATGTWEPGNLPMQSGEAIDAYEFLFNCRANPKTEEYGEKIVIIGGGNTAMDCARAAKKMPGVKDSILVYRRNKRNMPADEEELEFALEDNVEFRELLAPLRFENGILHCEEMKLGERDSSGRRSPVATGKFVEIACDTVIAAIGEKIDASLFEKNGVEIGANGLVKVNADTLETSQAGVYVIGDCHRGPATIVEAIADATKVAKAISGLQNEHYESENISADPERARSKHGILYVKESASTAERCLECATVCESCVDVCPNRANVSIFVDDGSAEVLHVDGMCNECGNCETFCPYSSAPYKDKFTIFGCDADYTNSENNGFVVEDIDAGKCKVRLEGKELEVSRDDKSSVPESISAMIFAVLDNYSYYLYS